MKLSEIGESGLLKQIRDYFSSFPPRPIIDIGDDAAGWIPTPSFITLASTDILIEEVHFKLEWSALDLLGRKAVNVNLSDLAAMGGYPRQILISLGLPEKLLFSELMLLNQGFQSAATEANTSVVGGDLSASSKLIISVTVIGEATQDKVVKRSGALPGDWIMVTGQPGWASAGRELLLHHKFNQLSRPGLEKMVNESEKKALKCFLDPQPRLKPAQFLANESLATAMIDISDGLFLDLEQLCTESQTSAEVNLAAFDYLEDLQKLVEPYNLEALKVVAAGEDYELLFTIKPKQFEYIKKVLGEKFNLPVYNIGKMTEKTEILIFDRSGKNLQAYNFGWDHFSKKSKASILNKGNNLKSID